MKKLKIKCDRCKKEIKNAWIHDNYTSGFYPSKGWGKYFYVHEDNICDKCMWNDSKYIKDYGYHDRTEE